ncbi:replication factor a2 [Paramyrothecium foliicola]|nr:replication factor a2 [Paramyrothecium foliicola]
MSAYGGYTKTGFGGNESGGFFAGSQQGSQGGEGAGPRGKNESLRPVTIKQIYDAEETYNGSEFKIDGAPASLITVVGQVRRATPQSTVINYRIGDGTGEIDVAKWINHDKQDEPQQTFELDSYVRVTGNIKAANNKRSVFSHDLRQVPDYNEVNYHMLESTYVHLFHTRGPLGAQNGAAADGDSMFVDGGDYAGGAGAGAAAGGQAPSKLSGCGPNARKMFTFMNNTPGGNEGIHLNVVTSSTGMALRDVLGAADELLGQGLIYTTVDDETWAILEY